MRQNDSDKMGGGLDAAKRGEGPVIGDDGKSKHNGKSKGGGNNHGGGGGGQSRASKKRARKKSKQMERQHRQTQRAEEEEAEEADEAKRLGTEEEKRGSKKRKQEVTEELDGDAGCSKLSSLAGVSDDENEDDCGDKDKGMRMDFGDASSDGDDDEDEKHDADLTDSVSGMKRGLHVAQSSKGEDEDPCALSRLPTAQILQRPPPTDEVETVGAPNKSLGEAAQLLNTVTAAARAKALLRSFLGPNVSPRQFYDKYWERQPLLVRSDGRTNATTSEPAETTDHGESHRFAGILGKADIQSMLEKRSLRYGRDLNVTNYCLQKGGSGLVKRRVTLDPPPQKRAKNKNKRKPQPDDDDDEDWEHVIADPADVWSNFENGCTVRLLSPHLYSDTVQSLLSLLELEWGCMVGANAYLTPGATPADDDEEEVRSQGQKQQQGFAPHYDDIEAFIMQLEGRKRWRVYAPLSRSEVLPRQSSADFREETDLRDVSPVLDVVLEPGDLLYMPRGWIHQAHTLFDGVATLQHQHSLHLTVSAMQQWAWVDLLELVMPQALEAAATSSRILREGLPRNFLNYMGTMHDPHDDPASLPEGLRQAAAAAKMREEEANDATDDQERMRRDKLKRLRHDFKEEGRRRIMRVCKEAVAMLEMGCDEMGKRFLSDRQPPALTPQELAMTRHGAAAAVKAGTGSSASATKIWPTTLCRLVRPGIARLVVESEEQEDGDSRQRQRNDGQRSLSLASGKAVVYHCKDNARRYRGAALSPLEFELDDAPAIEALLTTVEPRWIMVNDLYHDDVQDKVAVAQALYDEGILAICQTSLS